MILKVNPGIGTEEKEGQREYFINDNGVGFDIKNADQLFKPYQRRHTQQEVKGSGIGLTIAKKIIDRHGGEIRIEGERDNGATVFFSFSKS